MVKPAHPLVIGHRGDRANCPENTLAAFRACIEMGADGIEFDLQPSRDFEPMVIHDAVLRRTTGAAGRVIDAPSRTIARLDAGAWRAARFAGERVPRLRDVLALAPRGFRLLAELKTFGRAGGDPRVRRFIRRIVAELCSRPRGVEAFLLSFSLPYLRIARELAPEIPLALNIESASAYRAVRRSGFAGVDAVSFPLELCDPGKSRELHAAGKACWIWSIRTPRDVRRALALGADALICDDPGAALRLIHAARP